jgi:photosystem II stability/assembly factor-like uncharacterized protein
VFRLNTGRPTIAAEFLDDTFGIIADDHGAIYTTADGGQTWVKATDAAGSRVGLDVVDERVAWHIGAGGPVLSSTDGGGSWQAVSPLPYSGHVEFISFLDAQIGWAASAEVNQVWATDNGGQTWTELALPEGTGDIAAIALRTARDGYLLDRMGVLYITGDGGQSWLPRPLGLDEESAIPVLTHTAVVRFVDADHGLIVLGLTTGTSSTVVALRTADGGQTWEQEPVPVQMGTFCLTHDGTLLTVADLMDSAELTLLHTTVEVAE